MLLPPLLQPKSPWPPSWTTAKAFFRSPYSNANLFPQLSERLFEYVAWTRSENLLDVECSPSAYLCTSSSLLTSSPNMGLMTHGHEVHPHLWTLHSFPLSGTLAPGLPIAFSCSFRLCFDITFCSLPSTLLLRHPPPPHTQLLTLLYYTQQLLFSGILYSRRSPELEF